ncbi:MAG: hypothetical protein ACK50A_10555 [Sphingobacteriaceae bacterium]|jgi:hypothetical protein
MKTIINKKWSNVTTSVNYSIHNGLLTLSLVIIILLSKNMNAQNCKQLKLGFAVESGISGNGHGVIYNGMIHLRKGPHTFGMGASVQKRNFDFGGGKIKYSIALTDLINNEASERLDMAENIVNCDRDNIEVLPPEYQQNKIELNAFVFTQYINNGFLSNNTIAREKRVGVSDYTDWNKIRLSTIDFGLGFELKFNLTDRWSWKNYIAMSGYYHTNYNYKLYHSKYSPCLTIGTVFEFNYCTDFKK